MQRLAHGAPRFAERSIRRYEPRPSATGSPAGRLAAVQPTREGPLPDSRRGRWRRCRAVGGPRGEDRCWGSLATRVPWSAPPHDRATSIPSAWPGVDLDHRRVLATRLRLAVRFASTRRRGPRIASFDARRRRRGRPVKTAYRNAGIREPRRGPRPIRGRGYRRAHAEPHRPGPRPAGLDRVGRPQSRDLASSGPPRLTDRDRDRAVAAGCAMPRQTWRAPDRSPRIGTNRPPRSQRRSTQSRRWRRP